LPFLALGLGLDNVFLLARTYVFVCDRREFKCKDIVGVCLAEVGFDITFASFTNTCAFMMASLFSIGAVQIFARQVSFLSLEKLLLLSNCQRYVFVSLNVFFFQL